MASNSPEPNGPKPGGLLARLFGVNQPGKPGDVKAPAEKRDEAPVAVASASVPVTAPKPEPAPVPMAAPPVDVVKAAKAEPAPPPKPESVPLASPVVEEKTAVAVEPAAPAAEAPPQNCPICTAPRKGSDSYCGDCGFMFPANGSAAAAGPGAARTAPAAGARLKDRYELGEMISERGPVTRFRGFDHGAGNGQPAPVVILRMEAPEVVEALPAAEEAPPAAEEDDNELMPSFDTPALTAAPAAATAAGPAWPSIDWEAAFLDKAASKALPNVIETFIEGGFQYLVEEAQSGRQVWDIWDDPEATAVERYGLLKKIAQAVHEVHQGGAIFEGLRPDLIAITDQGQVVFTDLSDLLPLPVPPGINIRMNLYTPPELVLSPETADARGDLYSFGAMMYALEYLHHELAESDFERQFSPKLITDRCPDVHPGFFRLISKTFVRDVHTRFPTDEAVKEDATGFAELIKTLDVCARSFDNVRFDIAAWTTTGMVRTGNEDAFALLHAVESRQDELNEYALLLLADGMGGYEAGEVAAAMAIQTLRQYLLQQKMFASLAGQAPPEEPVDVEACKQIMQAALKHANKEVYTASRTPGKGKRGMGCTAEAVYVDAHDIVVGHVGDSRTYHLHQGRLVQMTRDQTFVNRMVELGALTPEEAEDHPRKNELQQAIGGQPDVVPGLYHGKVTRGDWILVCSDGLTNHIPPEDLQKMLLREATSAEEAARRLLNLVNLRGATDNSTVIIIRAC